MCICICVYVDVDVDVDVDVYVYYCCKNCLHFSNKQGPRLAASNASLMTVINRLIHNDPTATTACMKHMIRTTITNASSSSSNNNDNDNNNSNDNINNDI